MLRLALTPRWILALVAAIAIAAIFALLGQWQLSRAVAAPAPRDQPSETVVPLATIATPDEAPENASLGQRVSVAGRVAGDFQVLSDRINGTRTGYWLIARFEVPTEPADAVASADGPVFSLALALGWAPTAQAAKDAEAAIPTTEQTLEGRYLQSESPDADPATSLGTTMSVSALVNEWPAVGDGVYPGYVVAQDAPAGLTAIDSPAPSQEVSYNLLNLFYAIEWVVFAGLAFFLWYRLLKDAYERELEDAEDAAAAASAAAAAIRGDGPGGRGLGDATPSDDAEPPKVD